MSNNTIVTINGEISVFYAYTCKKCGKKRCGSSPQKQNFFSDDFSSFLSKVLSIKTEPQNMPNWWSYNVDTTDGDFYYLCEDCI